MLVRCDLMGDTPDDYTAQMRAHRNGFLAASDWTQTLDAPLTDQQRQAWAVYRQGLRDFPATWTAGPTADFPDPPSGGN
jgi:hypothetical protein